MKQTTINKDDLFKPLSEAGRMVIHLVSSTPAVLINAIPFPGSWTIADVVSHLTKSNNAIRQSLQMKGNETARDGKQRIDELKKIFLDFSVKFDAPEFIWPTKERKSKSIIMMDYKNSFKDLSVNHPAINLSEMLTLPVFGEITKLELLYFVLFHTQRHIHQFKNILEILRKKRT